MKKTLKRAVPMLILAVIAAAFVVFLVIKSTEKPYIQCETRYLTAEEKVRYDAVSQRYTDACLEFGLLDTMKETQEKLMNKLWLSRKDKELLASLPYSIMTMEQSLEGKTPPETIKAELDAIGTTEPMDGVEYAFVFTQSL